MPSTSRRQQRFMYAELARKEKGQATETGMTEKQLREFAETRIAGKKPKRGGR